MPLAPFAFYYRSQRHDVTLLRMRLRELAAGRPRVGYRRLHILLRREDWAINHKKTYGLYRDEQLGVRVHRRRKRASQLRVRLDLSRPGKPMDNPFIESFNGRLRDEHLNTELFFSVVGAQAKLLEWQRDYNEARPHSSLGQLSPREFAAAWQCTRTARGDIHSLETV